MRVTAASYTVVYQRDETGWWQARVPEVRGCHTQGRTVGEARRRIREALSLFVDDAATAELHDQVDLPTGALRAIDAYRKLRQRADEEDRKASEAARAAVAALRDRPLNMSLRDAAGLLNLSHQRVYQLRKFPSARVAMPGSEEPEIFKSNAPSATSAHKRMPMKATERRVQRPKKG